MIVSPVLAQSFEVPKYKFDKKEDFAKYEKDVLACVDWLERTPADTLIAKRKYAGSFLTAWVEGSPDVSIILRTYVEKLTDKNPALFTLFLGGWARYQLRNKTDKEEIHASLAAVKCIVTFYASNKNHGLVKDPDLEPLIGLSDTDLASWIEKAMNE